MRDFNEAMKIMTERTSSMKPFKKKIMFLLDGNTMYIDGTVNPPTVTTDGEAADATVTANLEDFHKLLNKELNPMVAFRKGQFRIAGDMMAATALQQIF